MRRWLNPEIALGFLLATLFWIGVLGWQSAYEPTDREEQECHDAFQKAGRKPEECKSLWEKTTTDPVAFFTLVLSISTIALWRATRSSVRVAERALTELERPFIGIEVVNSGFTVESAATEPYVMMGTRLVFHFANYGRTPATLTEVLDEFCICGPNEMPTPVNPEDRGVEYPFGVIVGADKTSPPSSRSQSRDIDPDTWLTFSAGDSELFLMGFVRFRDIFDKRHITGFCLKFNKAENRFLFDGDERYNYTRNEART
jgi:hypothetical protein